MDAEDARKRFELENDVKEVSPDNDADRIYFYDNAEQQKFLSAKPWAKDPNHFKKVKISAVALIKMVMHARSGGNIEVMGLMQGKIHEDTMIIMDAFALPVEGTETRVNAQAEGYEYMVNYMIKAREVGRLENAIGWYHSHPGYGCWLSGIDVSTQMLNQQYQEPFVAVVSAHGSKAAFFLISQIDPNRTIAAGKVEIGAFRTYPEGYKAPDEAPSEYQSIPLNKIEDFGVHCKQYYPLEVSYFKSSLDAHLLVLLWNKYWVNTLSSSSLLANRDFTANQIRDLAEKIEQADSSLSQGGRLGTMYAEKKKGESSALTKLSKDGAKISIEANHALLSQVLKNIVFNRCCKAVQ
ncbi:COP9 signalosome complex subunit 5a [Phlyctochytrium bullatum]|nr:COP9 signalosome complex subunit 5a [Phlyctochytrium bullatum]